ncbi:MAG: hypothetical protein SVV80_01790 [Planctomycetota bacterium]|nr:hypothetical protein [Planctomycetota bacterium]
MEKELAEYRAGKVTGYNSVIHNRLRKGQKKITFETAAWKQKQIADRELIMEKAKKELAGMKAELEAISK